MEFREYGDKSLPTVILLHGGGLSWWSLTDAAKSLQNRYHIVTPVIDGHGEDGETDFVSIEDSAQKLIAWIDAQCGGKVFAIGGLSLGAQITVEVLTQRNDIAEFAVIESALVCPLKGSQSMGPMLKMSYGLIHHRWFARLQAGSLSLPESMFERYFEDSKKMTLKSLTNITKSNGSYQMKPSLKGTKAKVLVIAGSKELGVMKKSARLLHDAIPASILYFADGLKHGELSICRSAEFVQILKKFFSGTLPAEEKA